MGLPSASFATTAASNVSPASIDRPNGAHGEREAFGREHEIRRTSPGLRSGSETWSVSDCVSLNSPVGSLKWTSPLASVVAV